jgi:hypothetical protein
MRRPVLLLIIAIALLTGTCSARVVKIHGFVTNVTSPTNFEIDDYRIARDVSLVIDVEKDESDDAKATFDPAEIRIGTELEIRGDFDAASGELKASSIKVFLDDTKRIKRTALVEKLPQLNRTESGTWRGVAFADGQKITIAEATVLTLKQNKSERKEAKSAKEEGLEPTTRVLSATSDITLDTFLQYEGARQLDGSILASKAEFQHAEFERGEAKLWKSLTPKIKKPTYTTFRSGELRVAQAKYKLFPSQDAQEYISKIGESLIPQHEKDLPEGNPLKIPFKFYIVEDKTFNASAYPNGVVVVHSGVFDVLENEAQLAFVLSHEISHAIEKHVWRKEEYHKKALLALRIGGAVGAGFGGREISNLTTLIEAGIRNGYSRSLENQADRVGLEWMLTSGYDIREAPRAWKAVALKMGDHATNIFWDDHDNNTTRRSYLMAELRNNYSDVEFQGLKKDSQEFHQISQILNDSRQTKNKIRVKVSSRK